VSNHRFILEPYKGLNSRYLCPQCNDKGKSFSRYIDNETNAHVNASVGKCNRESKCTYHYTPKQYFEDNKGFLTVPPHLHNNLSTSNKQLIEPTKPTSFISDTIFKSSLKGYDSNHFVTYLFSLFGSAVTSQLISRYFIATSKHWSGSTVFWQIDTKGKIRTGKIMLYNPTTGKRIKEPYNHIHWVHKAIKEPCFELKQCLYGQHLLIDDAKPVAVVESEKTAIISSVYLPQFIWVAVGSLNNLSADKCEILKGRTIVLFPDLNGFDKWSNKAKELSNIGTVIVSDLLELRASDEERKNGLDLADYLMRHNYKDFEVKQTYSFNQEVTFCTNNELNILPVKFKGETRPLIPNASNICAVNANNFIVVKKTLSPNFYNKIKSNWVEDIELLETYFATAVIPSSPIKLNQWSTILNASSFVDSHFPIVKANNGNSTFLPYLQRLQEFKELLELI